MCVLVQEHGGQSLSVIPRVTLCYPQVDEERKEAEAIKERVAKDEAAVAARQEEVRYPRQGMTTAQNADEKGNTRWRKPTDSNHARRPPC